MRESSRASNIQCSATFSYALFTNGSLACAAPCLASSAFRRQSTISDDIRGGPQMDRAKRQVRRCSGSERDVSPYSKLIRASDLAFDVALTLHPEPRVSGRVRQLV